jgi:hypothetical protein
MATQPLTAMRLAAGADLPTRDTGGLTGYGHTFVNP